MYTTHKINCLKSQSIESWLQRLHIYVEYVYGKVLWNTTRRLHIDTHTDICAYNELSFPQSHAFGQLFACTPHIIHILSYILCLFRSLGYSSFFIAIFITVSLNLSLSLLLLLLLLVLWCFAFGVVQWSKLHFSSLFSYVCVCFCMHYTDVYGYCYCCCRYALCSRSILFVVNHSHSLRVIEYTLHSVHCHTHTHTHILPVCTTCNLTG